VRRLRHRYVAVDCPPAWTQLHLMHRSQDGPPS
jgi:hypothetical protein